MALIPELQEKGRKAKPYGHLGWSEFHRQRQSFEDRNFRRRMLSRLGIGLSVLGLAALSWNHVRAFNEPSLNQQVESDPVDEVKLALKESLELQGEDVQIGVFDRPYVLQSIALQNNRTPLGHMIYDRPIRDAQYWSLTHGSANGPTFKAINYGDESRGTAYYWVDKVELNGRSSRWGVLTTVANKKINFEFVNIVDGHDSTDSGQGIVLKPLD